ncbi:hypothetical protein Hdeb2414_s0006g00220271 [Helianthus debilis subsp. tardiflorus]
MQTIQLWKDGKKQVEVKPLKELAFNSQNITVTMMSRQFQVMLDVLTNLLFARLPKPRRSSLLKSAEDDDDVEEEADEVVPDGVEENWQRHLILLQSLTGVWSTSIARCKTRSRISEGGR